MKKRSLVLAALAPLVAISGADAVADEMAAPEMRVWRAVLSEASEEAPGLEVAIVASVSTVGSNGMVVESVELVSTSVSKDDDGNMTESMASIACPGPVMVEGGSFMIGASAMEEADEAGEKEEEGCAFEVSGMARHTYRGWHSWDLSGTVTVGDVAMAFDIASPAPAMILEPEPEKEEG